MDSIGTRYLGSDIHTNPCCNECGRSERREEERKRERKKGREGISRIISHLGGGKREIASSKPESRTGGAGPSLSRERERDANEWQKKRNQKKKKKKKKKKKARKQRDKNVRTKESILTPSFRKQNKTPRDHTPHFFSTVETPKSRAIMNMGRREKLKVGVSK